MKQHGPAMIVFLGCVLFAKAAPAPDRTATAEPALGPARRALEQPATVDVAEAPLSTVLAQLGERAKVSIVLDRASVQQLGLDPNDLPVTARHKDAKLKTVLRSIASQHNLAIAAVGDTIVLTTEDVALQRLLRQPVDVDAKEQPAADALKRLARLTGTNVIIDPRQAKAAQKPVTLQVEDVPLEAAVRLVCEMAALKPVRLGNVLFVTSEERADKLKADGDLTPAASPSGPIGISAPPAAPAVVVPPAAGAPAVPAIPLQPPPAPPAPPAGPRNGN
jgi:type II secretory pathway component GspD/PulD (secretin)